MKHLYIRTFILLFACVCGVVGMRAEVLDLTKLMPKVKKGYSYPLTTVEQGGVLLTFGKGEGRVVPVNWGYARLYNNNTLTIAAQKNMRKVTLHFLKSGKEVLPKAGEMEVSSGKLTADNVWQGNAQQLVITVYPPRGKTFSLEKVEIAYEEGQTPPTTDPNEDKPKEEETIADIASFKQTEQGKAATLKMNKALVLGSNDAELFVKDHTALIRVLLSKRGDWQRGDLVTGEVRGVYEEVDALPTINAVERISLRKVLGQSASAPNVPVNKLSEHTYSWVHTSFTANEKYKLADSRTGVPCFAYNGAEIDCYGIVIPQGTTLILYPLTAQDVTINYYDDKLNTYGEAQNVNVHIHQALKQGVFNTLTLPVSLSASEVKSVFGQAAVIAKFAYVEGNNVVFQRLTDAGMQAGDPYLVSPQTDTKSIFVAQTQVHSPKTNPNSPFVGTLNATTPPAKSYYLNRQNKLQAFFGNQQIKAFKAYFNDIENAEGKTIVVKDVTNGIQQPTFENEIKAPLPTIYNLNGQRISGDKGALAPGIYIIDGKKTIVR